MADSKNDTSPEQEEPIADRLAAALAKKFPEVEYGTHYNYATRLLESFFPVQPDKLSLSDKSIGQIVTYAAKEAGAKRHLFGPLAAEAAIAKKLVELAESSENLSREGAANDCKTYLSQRLVSWSRSSQKGDDHSLDWFFTSEGSLRSGMVDKAWDKMSSAKAADFPLPGDQYFTATDISNAMLRELYRQDPELAEANRDLAHTLHETLQSVNATRHSLNPAGYSLTHAQITEIIRDTVADARLDNHVLNEGSVTFVAPKLLINRLDNKQTTKDTLYAHEKKRLAAALQNKNITSRAPKDYLFDSQGRVKEESLNALYEVMGSGDRDLHEAFNAGRHRSTAQQKHATKRGANKIISMPALLEDMHLELTDSTENPLVAILEQRDRSFVEAVVPAILEQYNRKIKDGLKIPALKLEDLGDTLAADYQHAKDSPLGKAGLTIVFKKLLIERAYIPDTKTRQKLLKEIKDDLAKDILSKKDGFNRDNFSAIIEKTGFPSKERLNPEKFDAFFATLGRAEHDASWEAIGKTRPVRKTAGAPTATTEEQTAADSGDKGKQAVTNPKTSVGAVGKFRNPLILAGAGLLAWIGGTATSKDPENKGAGQPAEEKNNFWPNVAKFLGVVALLGGLGWAAKVQYERSQAAGPKQRG